MLFWENSLYTKLLDTYTDIGSRGAIFFNFTYTYTIITFLHGHMQIIIPTLHD